MLDNTVITNNHIKGKKLCTKRLLSADRTWNTISLTYEALYQLELILSYLILWSEWRCKKPYTNYWLTNLPGSTAPRCPKQMPTRFRTSSSASLQLFFNYKKSPRLKTGWALWSVQDERGRYCSTVQRFEKVIILM